MRWGRPYATKSTWGANTGDGALDFCNDADDRVLVQMEREGTPLLGGRLFREFICDLVTGLGEYRDVLEAIKAAFDIDTAVGEQLDFIGTIVGLPRQGFPDVRYRVFLSIQTDILLSAAEAGTNWTGTVNNILKMTRTFIGVGGAIALVNTPPYAFLLSVPLSEIDEIHLLVNFLCVAIYAGVLGNILFALEDDSLWDSTIGGPITNGGIWCSSTGVGDVSPCATWGHAVTIGTQDCE